MKEIHITSNEAGKKLDKFLSQYFSNASMGFLYKMLRKKNIVLNKKKASGKEELSEGDIISVFFADETFEKFANNNAENDDEYLNAYKRFGELEIIYEDQHILLLNKPSGILSQKADGKDFSLNEWLIGYLLNKKEITKEQLTTFRPSVCNRLDRNTSGIVICSKSLQGARKMAEILKDRSLHKYYKTIVSGTFKEEMDVDGYLLKDEKTNTVKLVDSEVKDSSRIQTSFKPEKCFEIELKDGKKLKLSEIEVLLHTGKTHQIRAHLSSLGFPIVGDSKYGNDRINKLLKENFKLKYQLLHAERLVFPAFDDEFSYLSGKVFKAKLPELFLRLKTQA